jgi:hypothetical protein
VTDHGESRGCGGFACDLTALDPSQRERRALLAAWVLEGAMGVVEQPDGYDVHLEPRSRAAEHVEELVALERLCCPFLRLSVAETADHRGKVLEIRGEPGVKPFVAAELGFAP